MGIESQFRRIIFLPDLKYMNFYPHWGYTTGTEEYPPLGYGGLDIMWDILLIHLEVLSYM